MERTLMSRKQREKSDIFVNKRVLSVLKHLKMTSRSLES